MASNGEVKIKITGDDKELEQSLKGIKGKAESALGGIGKVAGTTAKGVLAVSAAMGAAAAAVTNIGSEFESAFAQVQTIMDVNQLGIEEMKDQILALSSATGVAASDLSASVYNAISATGDTANAVTLVEGATKLATAGFTDTESALGVITTAMNAYGLSAEEATRISDSLVQTQNLGVTTISELSASMGKAIASASAYSIDLGNVEAAYVAMTKSGISTAESTTYMSSMFKELGSSSSNIGKTLQKETGKSFDELMKSGASLADVLKIVYDAAGQDSTALMNMWGSAEAGKAANAIINQGLEAFNDNLASIEGSAGTTEAAYEKMTQTVEHQTELLKNTVSNLAIDIFDAYQPQVAGMISDANGWMTTLAEGFKSGGVDGLEAAANEIAPQVVNALSSGINAAVGAVSGALPGLLNSLTGIAKNVISGLGKTLPTLMTGLVSQLPTIISSIGSLVPEITTGLFDALAAGVSALIPMIPEIAMNIGRSLLEGIVSAINGVDTVLMGAFKALGLEVEENVDGANGVVKKAFSNLDTDESKDYHLDLDPSVNVNEVSDTDLTAVTEMGKQAMTDIVGAYTDGIGGNDAEANAKFKQDIQATVDTALAEIEAYRTNALAALDGAYEAGQISKEAYDTQAAEINATAEAMITDVQTAASDMRAWGDTYAGAATSTVKAHVSELEDAVERISAVETRINEIDGHVRQTTTNLGTLKQKVVTEGLDLGSDSVLTALTYENDQLTSGIDAINAQREAALTAAATQYGSDTQAYTAACEAINADYDAQVEALQSSSADRTAALWKAVTDGYLEGTDVVKNLDIGLASQNVLDMGTQISEMIDIAFSNFEFDPTERRNYIIRELGKMKFTDSDWAALAEAMGIDSTQPNFKNAIYEGMMAMSAGIDENTFGMVMDQLNLNAQKGAKTALADLPEGLQTIISEAIRTGLVDGVSIDANGEVEGLTAAKLRELLTATMGDAEKGLQDIEGAVVQTETVVENTITVENTTENGGSASGGESAGDVAQQAKEQVEQELKDADTGEPVKIVTDATVDLNVTATVSGTDFSAAGAQAASQFAQGIADSASQATTAATTMANEAAGKLKANTFSLGVDFSQGLARGISAGASSAINAAIQLAKDSLAAAKKELDINSPSKKTKEIGRFFGEGYEIGIRESMADAVMTAKRMTGEILNASIVGNGGLGVLRVEAGGDPLQVEMQGADRPVLLDGVQIAEIQAGNNTSSIAMNDRRYRRSVGG